MLYDTIVEEFDSEPFICINIVDVLSIFIFNKVYMYLYS